MKLWKLILGIIIIIEASLLFYLKDNILIENHLDVTNLFVSSFILLSLLDTIIYRLSLVRSPFRLDLLILFSLIKLILIYGYFFRSSAPLLWNILVVLFILLSGLTVLYGIPKNTMMSSSTRYSLIGFMIISSILVIFKLENQVFYTIAFVLLGLTTILVVLSLITNKYLKR